MNINGHTYVNGGYNHHQQPHSYQNFTNFNGNYAGYNNHATNFHQNNHYNHYNNHGMNMNVNSPSMNNGLTPNYNQAPLSSYQAQIPTI